MATEHLLEFLSSDSAPDRDLASFARSSGREGCYAVYVAKGGKLSKEEKSVFDELGFSISYAIGKYYDLLKREPAAPEEKLDFFLNEYSWSGGSGPVVLRVVDLGGSVVDELAGRMATCATGPLEATEDLDTVVLGFYVLAALGDPRVRDFPLEHFLESPRTAERVPDSRIRWRKAFERSRARAPGEIDLKRTKSFAFLAWSRSLPRKVSFQQVD